MLTRRMTRCSPELMLMPEMNRLVDSLLAGTPGGFAAPGVAALHPAINVLEDEHALTIEAELPGYSMDNIEIALLGPELTISGSREAKASEGTTVHRSERGGSNTFSRSIRVATPIDADKVVAKLELGVLTITLPKSEAAKPRKIEIRGQ